MIVTFMKTKFIKIKKKQTQAGFGLLETTAAAMLSLLFVSMGANLVLTANLYKIKAKRNDVMNSLIRADVESIKYQSTKLQSTPTKCSADQSDTAKLSDGFAWALKTNIGVNSATPNIKTTTTKILGRNYILTRTIDLVADRSMASITNINPVIDPDILPISYSFARQQELGEIVTPSSEYNLSVQIIPNESLKCSAPI